MADITEFQPHSGRFLNESSAVVNIADLVSTTGIAVTGLGSEPSASITRPDNATAYAIGDVVGTDPATNIAFANVASKTGAHIIVLGICFRINVGAIPAGLSGFRLHLYNAAPTAIADNSAYNLTEADRAKYLGFVSIDTPLDLGDTLYVRNDNLNFKTKLATGSTTLYGILETRGAFTPTAQAVKAVCLHVVEV